MSDTQNRPTKTFRYGGVSASIFGKQIGDEGRSEFYTSLQRRYRDAEGEWQNGALRLQDLPLAIRSLERAQQFLESMDDSP